MSWRRFMMAVAKMKGLRLGGKRRFSVAADVRRRTNSKHQAPTSKHQRNFKLQTPNSNETSNSNLQWPTLEFGVSVLVFHWRLVFGHPGFSLVFLFVSIRVIRGQT